VDFYSPSAAKR